ncbi:uncharacterized protein LAESUDRAFT_698039 [Laetiporus sulphureus 93-53]|uniref:DUF4100 domain-containing protein n=1 Tax=Laetiporus sulphureus 93-53 TaxID=1314785 RepID=A0A165EYC3_9APHY|nr:uncharacterized protein LAESUDRAFT_698039 [Laetiporus sulphureus 93-53]KZT07976.1 hypothetical protein LAESUDRAFT_698039 [Laetiporus sulphureus 93-53]
MASSFVQVPMPLPGAREAPEFKGKRLSEFIDTLEAMAKAAGVDKADLPNHVMRYCSSEVRRTLKHETAFSSTARDWDKAKERLGYFYSSSDGRQRRSADGLRRFSKRASAEEMVRSRRTLDKYICGFNRKAGDLVDKKLITEEERDALFYKGLPETLREQIKGNLEKDLGRQLTLSAPPPIDNVVDEARKRYNVHDIDYESDDSESERGKKKKKRSKRKNAAQTSSSSSDSDSSGDGECKKRRSRRKRWSSSSSDSGSESSDDDGWQKRHEKRKGKKGEKSKRKARQSSDAEAEKSSVAELKEQMRQLRIAVAQSASMGTAPVGQASASERGQLRDQYEYGQAKACYMCRKVEGVDLDHPLSMRKCPETVALILEGLLKYSAEGRIIRCDGTGLPRFPGKGGIASLIQLEMRSRGKDRERDLPPHQSGVCQVVGLMQEGRNVIQGSVFAVAAEDVYAFPVTTRSKAKATVESDQEDEIQRSVRFEFEHEGADDTTHKDGHPESIKVQQPADPTRFTRMRNGSDSGKKRVSFVPHPSNTEAGWRQAEKARTDEKKLGEINERYGPKGSGHRFTSQIQDSVSMEEVQMRLLDTEVSLPLRALLGVSPELQKRMTGLTRLRREASIRAAEGEVLEEIMTPGTRTSKVKLEDELEEQDRAEAENEGGYPSGAAYLTCATTEEAMHILDRYASAIVVEPKRYFAMACGTVQGKFGTEDCTFLVDSGSELNLITQRVYDRAGVELDSDGSRWSLKGISGEPVRLLGCCRDVSVEIGGERFNHHFFVGLQEYGSHDGILGQPWLQWFSAHIEYQRGGSVKLVAYPFGDSTRKPVKAQVVGISHQRNTDRLVMASTLGVGEGAGF